VAFTPPEGTRLERALGRGTVFDVALVTSGSERWLCKRLAPRARGAPAGRAAIVREARALALARHAALPTLVHVGTDAHGPFVLETIVDGLSAQELAAAWRARGAPVPAHLVRHIAREACAALAELHALADESGPIAFVHGDLAPDHVIVRPDGAVAFIDLGAARFRGLDAALETDDRGTLPFVAPEVARGEARPSACADAYALAAVVLSLGTPEPLSRAPSPAAMLAEIGDRGLALADLLGGAVALTAAQREALARALAFDPRERDGDVRALAAAFDPDR
jgi:serine/threonine protein kinase